MRILSSLFIVTLAVSCRLAAAHPTPCEIKLDYTSHKERVEGALTFDPSAVPFKSKFKTSPWSGAVVHVEILHNDPRDPAVFDLRWNGVNLSFRETKYVNSGIYGERSQISAGKLMHFSGTVYRAEIVRLSLGGKEEQVSGAVYVDSSTCPIQN